MQIKKLKIEDHIFDINLSFYNFLKKITQSKLSDSHINDFLEKYYSHKDIHIDNLKEMFFDYINLKMAKRKNNESIYNLIVDITKDNISIFIFALKLNLIKDLLLKEANLSKTIKIQELKGLNSLSLAYDKISTQVAYSTRISGALLSLLFFESIEKDQYNFLVEGTQTFIENLAVLSKSLVKQGLEPNQIFMLLFSESINQSITSSSGVSYEDRIRDILISIGITSDNIKKIHDENDKSTEFDFFFTLANRTYGIGAKRTLRERYKQFIKTAHMSKIDIMIEITLGTDLRPNIAKSIRDHGIYIFVADEVYKQKEFLQQIEGIFPASELTLNLLESLG